MNLRQRMMLAADRALTFAVPALVLGSALSFGGAVWWFRPAAAFLTFFLAAVKLVQFLIQGRMLILKSPLTSVGLLMLALGVVQLIPLPPHLATKVSPASRQIYTLGALPRLVEGDDPGARLPEPPPVRSPATIDRSATLRWLAGAAVCMGIFWVVSHFADRLGRFYLVCGSIVAAFLLNGAMGLVQIGGEAEGLLGWLLPGRAPIWAPSLDDLLESPTTAALRRVAAPGSPTVTSPDTIALVPERPFLFGTMMGGPGAFLAFGSMALPLALAIALHLLAPRGSRESLASRLSHAGQGSLVVLILVLLIVSAFLVGMMAGPSFGPFFAIGLVAVGLPCAATPGSRGSVIGLTLMVLMSLGLGALLVGAWPSIVGDRAPIAPLSWETIGLVWTESRPILRDFPWVGTGFGTFPAIYPYWKTQDATSNTALSSLMQCGIESGAVGLGLLGLAVLWCVCRLPSSLKRVGTADRALAYGLIGAAVSFSLWSVVHWTIELPAVAISASALGGTWNRWLAGGTDLFVERG